MSEASKRVIRKAASVIGTRHRTLRLQGVPTWVTPADVRRMAERTGTRGLVDVTLEHENGMPTGTASIEYNTPNQTKRAARLLSNATLSSVPLRVTGFEHGVHPKYFRGQKVDEGYVSEVSNAKAPATVVVFGFPAKWGLRETRTFLHDYRLDTWGEPVEAFKRIFVKGSSSRWVIHLSKMEDAHRLVRHLHMNRFALGHRTDTLLGARILY